MTRKREKEREKEKDVGHQFAVNVVPRWKARIYKKWALSSGGGTRERGGFKRERVSAVGRNEKIDGGLQAWPVFKQWPPLFACNYLADDLTLATLHLYNTVAIVRYASVAFRCAGVPCRAVLNDPWTASVILFYLSDMDFGNPAGIRLKRLLMFI